MTYVHKDLRDPVRAALAAGWQIKKSGGHGMLVSPDGATRIGLTLRPAPYSVRCVKSSLRRHGIA